MKITVDIDVERIEDMIALTLAHNLSDSRDMKHGARDGIDKAIQKYIYSQKENIIERVIERASIEIVKKGLPKLLANLTSEGLVK